MSKKVENQRYVLHQKEKKILQQNQLILKHEEAMKQEAVMNKEKKEEVSE